MLLVLLKLMRLIIWLFVCRNTYSVSRMCSNRLHTSAFKTFVSANYCAFACLEQCLFKHTDIFMSLNGCLNPEHFTMQCYWLKVLQSILCWYYGSEEPGFHHMCHWRYRKMRSGIFAKTRNKKPIWSKIR